MKLLNSAAQQAEHYLYPADLTLTGSAQLVLARSLARSYLLLQNRGTSPMYIEIGAGAAHATVSGGKVTAVTVDNAGFGFTRAPRILLLGGGYAGNTSYGGLNQPLGASPSDVARAVATLSGGAIASIAVPYQGSLYACAPFVQVIADELDPYGAALPSAASSIQLAVGEKLEYNGTFAPTEAISVIGTASDKLICRWAE